MRSTLYKQNAKNIEVLYILFNAKNIVLNQLDFKEATPSPTGGGVVMLIAAAKGVDALERFQ